LTEIEGTVKFFTIHVNRFYILWMVMLEESDVPCLSVVA